MLFFLVAAESIGQPPRSSLSQALGCPFLLGISNFEFFGFIRNPWHLLGHSA
jgi:hypothetical protein